MSGFDSATGGLPPVDLSRVHWRARRLALELRGLAHLLGRERPEDPDLADEESRARQGIGLLVLRLATEARRLTTAIDEYLVQNSRREET